MRNYKKIMDNINKVIVDKNGIDNVMKVLKAGFLSKPEGGEFTSLFQKKTAKKIGRKFAFTTNSRTSALHGAISALGLKPGDEVLMPSLTFFADASVVLQEKAQPVFVDISPEDFNIDPKDLERKITKKSKAIIVVHLYGKPGRMEEICRIARKHDLVLIEDCAQAFGAKIGKKYVGSFGDFACFSFYQTKHLVTGEGGMILTDSPFYAEALKSVLNNGIKRSNLDEYNFDHIGTNYQLSEIQCALGVAQLKRIDGLNKIRRHHAEIYRKTLAGSGLDFQSETSDYYNVYCHFSCLLPPHLKNKREEFMAKVHSYGVPIKKLYPMTLSETDISKRLGLGDISDVPVAYDVARRVFNLYVNPGLKDSDIKYFAKIVLKVLGEFNK